MLQVNRAPLLLALLATAAPWRCTSSSTFIEQLEVSPQQNRALSTEEWETTTFSSNSERQSERNDAQEEDDADEESNDSNEGELKQETNMFEKWLEDAALFQQQETPSPAAGTQSPQSAQKNQQPTAAAAPQKSPTVQAAPNFFPPFFTFEPLGPTTTPVEETERPVAEPTEPPETEPPVAPDTEPPTTPLTTDAPTVPPTEPPVAETPPPTKAPVQTKAPSTKAPVSSAPATQPPSETIDNTTAPSITPPIVNETTAPSLAPIVLPDVTAAPSVDNVTATGAPTGAPVDGTTTIDELVENISIELQNVTTELSAVELIEFKIATEAWFNGYYVGAVSPFGVGRRLRRRGLSRALQVDLRSLVSGMNSTLSEIVQSVTPNNTNILSYAQQMTYVVSSTDNATLATVTPVALLLAAYGDSIANTDYYQRLINGNIVALDSLVPPIPLPRLETDVVETTAPTPAVAATVPPSTAVPAVPALPTEAPVPAETAAPAAVTTAPVPAAPTAEVAAPTVPRGDDDDDLSVGAIIGIVGAAVAVLGLGGYALFAMSGSSKPTQQPVVVAAAAPMSSGGSVIGGRGGDGSSVIGGSVVSATGTTLTSRRKIIHTPTAQDISRLSTNEDDGTKTTTTTAMSSAAKAVAPASGGGMLGGKTLTAASYAQALKEEEDILLDDKDLDDSYEGKSSVDTSNFDYSQIGQSQTKNVEPVGTAGAVAAVAAAVATASDTVTGGSDQRSASQGDLSQDDGGASKTGSKYADSDLPIEEDHFVIYAPAGKLGLVVDNPDDGAPVVHAIKEDSVLVDQVRVGDRLVGVDEIDVRSLSPVKVSKLISKRSTNPLRKLTLIRSKTDLDDDVTESAQSTMDTNSQDNETTQSGYNHRRNDSDDASSNIGSMSHLSGDDGNDSIDFHDDNSQIDAMSQTGGGLDDDGSAPPAADKPPGQRLDP